MLLSEMSPRDAAEKIVKSTDLSFLDGYNDWDKNNTKEGIIKTLTNDVEKMIDFGRTAQIISVEIRANRGSAAHSLPSTKYPGVYVHQIITLSNGKMKYEARHPDHIMLTSHEFMYYDMNLFNFMTYKNISFPSVMCIELRESIPQLNALLDKAVEIRDQFTPDVVEEAAEKYVIKNQSKAKNQIVKKLGNFLTECNLRDEDPKFLLQIMKFVGRDNFWELKNFFNYCRRNTADINFLTEEEITQAQNLAIALDIQQS